MRDDGTGADGVRAAGAHGEGAQGAAPGGAEARRSRPSHDASRRRPFGPEDAWVDGPSGRFWGRLGAAGLLALRDDGSVLLQERAEWSHFGGTWGTPGGARKAGESAMQAALREADEEAGVPAEAIAPFGEHVRDLGYWSYVTVLARVVADFEPVIGDAETSALRWVPVPEVAALPLHPAFAEAWPGLKVRLESET